MPSSVVDLFAAARLEPEGVVRWGKPVDYDRSGVYLVAITDDPNSRFGLPQALIAPAVVDQLLTIRPELTLYGRRPSATELSACIAGFWSADEPILYIGLASSLRSRVRDFYRTAAGARRPHSGGWFLKTLSNIDDLYVHFARTAEVDAAEIAMLEGYIAAVSDESQASLADPEHPWPFANLEIRRDGRKIRKQHGIRGARGDRPE